MAIYHEDIADINLNGGSLHRSFKTVNIGSGDQNANRFGMRVYRNKEAVDLSGVSCQAVFQDPMGNNIALTNHGTVSGNTAYVTLPQACYNYEGRFCLAIKLIGGGVTGTMRIVDGVINNTHTGGAVAPTSAVPTYQEVLAAYDDAIAAVEDVTNLRNNLTDIRYGDICMIGDLEQEGTAVIVPDFINNTVVTATGEIGSASSKRITNKTLIYIPDGATFETTVDSAIYNPIPYCFDAKGSFIGKPNTHSSMLPGTRYVRFLISRFNAGDITPTEAKALFTLTIRKTTTDAKISSLKGEIPEFVIPAISETGLNKYNPDTKTTGFINANTGSINPNADYFTSDFIDVSDFIKGYAFTPKARKILFYDANKDAIAASYHNDETAAGVITINSSYKYIRLSWYKTSTNVMVCDAASLPAYQPYKATAKDGIDYLNEETRHGVEQMIGGGGSKSLELASFLNGKTIAVFGDSIMYGAGSDAEGPADILADKYGMTVEKYCVSGSTMGVRTDSSSYTVDEVHHIAKQIRNAIAASIDPDIILINGGTNDIGGQITIGEMSEVYTQPSAESYFANGFETAAYLLMKNFVGVPVIYMRAHNMSSRSYSGQIDYGELGVQIAEKWGIRVIDMYKRMNTQLEEYRTAYLADYTHPNEDGYLKYYIPAIEELIYNEMI